MSGLITLGMAMTTGTPASADVDSVSGGATALSIGGTPTLNVQGSATEPTDGYGPIGSGFLPSGTVCPSGSLVPPLGLPILLSLGLLDACTRGGGVAGENHLGFAESSAAVANVVIGGTLLGVVRSACRADGDGAVGTTEIIGSGIPGLPTNPAPNTVVNLPGILPLGGVLTLVLNEQIVTNVPGTADITVRAVRLSLLGINIILAESRCTALGPNVNVTPTTAAPTTTSTTLPGQTTTTSTTLPGQTTTTSTTSTSTTSTTTPAVTTTVAGGGNNNTNTNNNNNTSNNTNNNETNNENSNTNTNNQNQENNQTQTQTGGDNTNVNENVITITNLGSDFDDFHRRGHFENDDGAHGGDGKHFGKALARTGSESSRLTGVALLLLLVGSVLVFGTRTVATEGAAVPGSRAARRRSLRALFSPSRRWR